MEMKLIFVLIAVFSVAFGQETDVNSVDSVSKEMEALAASVTPVPSSSMAVTDSPFDVKVSDETQVSTSPQSVVGIIRDGYGMALNALAAGPREIGTSLLQSLLSAVQFFGRIMSENDLQTPVSVVTSLLNRKSRQLQSAARGAGLFDIVKRTLMSLASVIGADFKHIGFLLHHFGLALMELSKSMTTVADDLMAYSNGTQAMPDINSLSDINNMIDLERLTTAAPMKQIGDQVVKLLSPSSHSNP